MFNKTIRSVLSLALVFCLLLGMSGNAIAMAVSNPVDGALGQVDTKVYGTIAELNAMIDDLEDQIDTLEAVLLEGEEKLAEGKQLLEDAKQMLADVEAGDLKEANEKLAEAQQMLAEAKDKISPENLPALREEAYAKAMEEFERLKAEKIEEVTKEFNEAVEDAKAEATEQYYEKLAEAEKEATEKYYEKLAEAEKEATEKYYEKLAEAEAEFEEKKAEKLAEAEAEFEEKLAEKIAEADAEYEAKKAEKIAEAKAEFEEKKAEGEAEAKAEYDRIYQDAVDAGLTGAALEAKVAEAQAEYDRIYNEKLAEAQKEFDEKLAEKIAEADAEYAANKAKKIAEAKAEFEEKKAEKLAEAQKEFDEKKAEKIEEAKQEWETEKAKKIEEAKEKWETEKAKKIEEAKEKWDEEYDKKVAEITEEYYKLLAEAEAEFEETFEREFNETLAEAQETLAKAETELKKVEEYVGNINEAVAGYKQTIADAEAMIAEAELMIADAKVAIAQARQTIDQARTLVNNLEKSYNDLRYAVTHPSPSVSYIKNTVATVEADYYATWNALLELDKDIDELIAAYEVMAKYEIGGIAVEPFHQDAVDIEAIQMEVNGTVYGIEAMTLPEVNVNYEFSFSGISLPELPETVNTLDTTLDNIIAKGITLNAALHYYVAAAKNAVAKTLEIAGAAAAEIEQVLGISFDALSVSLNRDLHIRAYNWLYNNPDVVCGLVKKFGVFGLDLLVKFGPYALDLLQNNSELAIFGMKVTVGGTYLTVTLGAAVLGYVGDRMDFLADYKDDVVKAAGKLYAKYGDEAKALIEVYVDYLGLRERYENATHADYDIFHDSLYVAIGDSTAAVSGSYVEKLAEMMGIPHMTENLGQFDMTVADAIGMVGQNAELIGKADLITLGFSNIPASFEVMNALVADYDNDFTTQVGNIVTKSVDKVIYEVKEHMAAIGFSQDKIALVDRAGEMVDNGLTALNNRLIAEGLDEATINMVMQATEAYAVAYLSRAVWYPCLVNAVQDVNPDAQIVIVGTYNDLDGVVLEVSGRNVNIGEYVKYLVAAANLENLVQAFFEDGVIYVNAHNVETVFEENAYEGLNNLGYLQAMFNDEMLPSEAGATYIAEQIFDALDIEYKILGDVNGDHKVNCRDARLLLLYAAELVTEDEIDLTWADVNGDGRVNTRDARLVLLYCVELIEHFPACNLS